jgi:hypothetical protein
MAFEVGIALANQRRLYLGGGLWREAEFFEFVDLVAVAIADADDRVGHVGRRNINDALPAAADHLKADIGFGDDAADKRGRELDDGVPAHGHDVGPALPGRADEDDGAGLEELADVLHGEIAFHVGFHGGKTSCECERAFD